MAFERFFSFSITLCRFVCDRTSQLANLFSTLSVVEASCAASGFRYALKTHERGPRYLYANPPIQLFGAGVLSGNQSLARLSTHVWHFVIVRRTCKRSAFLRRGLLNAWKTKYWLMFLLASALARVVWERDGALYNNQQRNRFFTILNQSIASVLVRARDYCRTWNTKCKMMKFL